MGFSWLDVDLIFRNGQKDYRLCCLGRWASNKPYYFAGLLPSPILVMGFIRF
jgi:hypothetical protein